MLLKKEVVLIFTKILKLDSYSSPIRAYKLHLGYNKSLDINKNYILLWHVELNTFNQILMDNYFPTNFLSNYI